MQLTVKITNVPNNLDSCIEKLFSEPTSPLVWRNAGVKLIELIISSHRKGTILVLHKVVIRVVKTPWILDQVITNLRTIAFKNIGVIPEVLRIISIEGRPIPIPLKGVLG